MKSFAASVCVCAAAAGLVFAGNASAEASVTTVIEGSGAGRVVGTVVAPVGVSRAIDCPGTCSVQVLPNLVVRLHAVPDPGSAFAGWTVPELSLVAPPTSLYTGLTSIVDGCGTEAGCTVQVASAPDTLQPGCGYTSNCYIPHFADLAVRATFVLSPVERQDSTFLCYSRFPGSIPGVWPFQVAQRLLDTDRWLGDPLTGGYSIPLALPGEEAGGTNVGGYHLVCNPRLLVAAGGYINSGGDRISGGDAAVIRADLHSELNLFPVYSAP